jgi:hypothetical protein
VSGSRNFGGQPLILISRMLKPAGKLRTSNGSPRALAGRHTPGIACIGIAQALAMLAHL